MYLMDFEEYLWANGVQDDTIIYLKKCFTDREPVSKSVHNTMNKLFYSYIAVGGMLQHAEDNDKIKIKERRKQAFLDLIL